MAWVYTILVALAAILAGFIAESYLGVSKWLAPAPAAKAA